MPESAEQRAVRLSKAGRELVAYLDARIPELHKQGVKGRAARVAAEAEFWKGRRDG